MLTYLRNTVHQEGLSTEEKILRYFDMSSQYGVSCPVCSVGKCYRLMDSI